ncbi:hypothetical protein [Leifsonia sp. fls2-241-R2A-40a]|uniref:hypothetical protein n=1 Tax=Leifsonia sp. fls2-241-R2A-40a TaxID=3040290 RepID=UPI00254A1DDE|nr:hypothetical protein [Leifsonia sp. fls2-241-R2A-40a]
MIADVDVIAELKSIDEWRYASSPGRPARYDYRVLDVRALPGLADFEVRQRDGLAARIQIALPSAVAPQHWLYVTPENARDWVSQLVIWLDEEVYTGGLGEDRSRVERDGASYVVVESYGWQLRDPHEHARLKALAGEHGWNGGNGAR